MFEKPAYFIAGTDTSCGKTYVTCQLLSTAKAQGINAIGLKPVASGCDTHGANEDALSLQAQSSGSVTYQQVNPFCYRAPVSPNIAAAWENKTLSVNEVVAAVKSRTQERDTLYFVEGIGGVSVPLNHNETGIDLLKYLRIPVIVVIGLKLGCLNHALLTFDCLLKNQINVIGWIANQIDPDMLAYDENFAYLRQRLNVACLAEVKYRGRLEFLDGLMKY